MPFLVEKVINRKNWQIEYCQQLSVLYLWQYCLICLSYPTGKESSISILDYKTSWSIAIDSLKTSPLIGVGPGNYNQAFTQFKPLAFNTRTNWDLKYIQGSGGLMTIFTEVGLLGIIITFHFGQITS